VPQGTMPPSDILHCSDWYKVFCLR